MNKTAIRNQLYIGDFPDLEGNGFFYPGWETVRSIMIYVDDDIRVIRYKDYCEQSEDEEHFE